MTLYSFDDTGDTMLMCCLLFWYDILFVGIHSVMRCSSSYRCCLMWYFDDLCNSIYSFIDDDRRIIWPVFCRDDKCHSVDDDVVLTCVDIVILFISMILMILINSRTTSRYCRLRDDDTGMMIPMMEMRCSMMIFCWYGSGWLWPLLLLPVVRYVRWRPVSVTEWLRVAVLRCDTDDTIFYGEGTIIPCSRGRLFFSIILCHWWPTMMMWW